MFLAPADPTGTRMRMQVIGFSSRQAVKVTSQWFLFMSARTPNALEIEEPQMGRA